jgi:LEA14-like dessication related protein
MKRNIKMVLLITIAVIYIIVGVLLFFNIQSMEAPEIIINIEVGEINSENAVLNTKMDIYNPNSFEIVTKNLLFVTTTPDGYEVARSLIEGGEIGAKQRRTFSEEFVFSFNGQSPDLLTSKITGDIGANIFFIQKTIPLNVGIVTSLEKLIDEITLPSMDTTIEVTDITNEGIEIDATVDVYNPNDFEINIADISNNIETKAGKKIGSIDIVGGSIPGNKKVQIIGKGIILLEAFNEKNIDLNLSGTVGATIAGFEKNLSFNIISRIITPNLQELIFSEDKPTILSVKIKGRFTISGYLFEIIMEVDNTYKVDLIFRNSTSEIYYVKNGDHQFIGKCDKIEDIIVKSGEKSITECEILVPYSKFFSIDRSTDWIMNTVTSKISIVGVNQSVFFEVRGYQEINIIT